MTFSGLSVSVYAGVFGANVKAVVRFDHVYPGVPLGAPLAVQVTVAPWNGSIGEAEQEKPVGGFTFTMTVSVTEVGRAVATASQVMVKVYEELVSTPVERPAELVVSPSRKSGTTAGAVCCTVQESFKRLDDAQRSVWRVL